MHRRNLLKLAAGLITALVLPFRPRAAQAQQHVPQFDVLPVMQFDFQARLRAAGIPLDPAHRTPAQEHTAAMEFWAVRNGAALQATTITQHALEATADGNGGFHLPHFPPINP
jgi:hypothetical protein